MSKRINQSNGKISETYSAIMTSRKTIQHDPIWVFFFFWMHRTLNFFRYVNRYVTISKQDWKDGCHTDECPGGGRWPDGRRRGLTSLSLSFYFKICLCIPCAIWNLYNHLIMVWGLQGRFWSQTAWFQVMAWFPTCRGTFSEGLQISHLQNDTQNGVYLWGL